MKPEESETPVYNMVLEFENINLYEVTLKVQRKGGAVLDLNTDSVVCEFEKFPFKIDEYLVITMIRNIWFQSIRRWGLPE